MSAAPSTQPYLLRAIYDWAVDNGFTPHLLVDANAAGARLPPGYARDGRITLNIHPRAVHALQLGNDAISFSARFGGRRMEIVVPVNAVLAIYAQENGQGIGFQPGAEPGLAGAAPPESVPGEPPVSGAPAEPPTEPPPPRGRPSLKRVK